MKSLSVLNVIAAAVLLCVAPFSIHWSPANSRSLAVVLNTASAAELEVPAHRRAYQSGYHARYHRAGLYDPYCGGPYVGGGWNGGTYYGGPWIDLRCYGVSVER
jgi:hypothetical protein